MKTNVYIKKSLMMALMAIVSITASAHPRHHYRHPHHPARVVTVKTTGKMKHETLKSKKLHPKKVVITKVYTR